MRHRFRTKAGVILEGDGSSFTEQPSAPEGIHRCSRRLFSSLALTPGVDAFGGASRTTRAKAYPPVYVPAESPSGYLYQPAIDLHTIPRLPGIKYMPKAGDVLLLSDPDPLFNVLYVICVARGNLAMGGES